MYKFDLNDYNEYYYNKQLQPHEVELSHEDFVGCPAEEIISKLTAKGYTFDDSEAVEDGNFVGLVLDEINEDDKTEERINAWLESIKPSL